MSDAFKDRLAEVAGGPAPKDLAHQGRGRPVAPAEQALADALMEIMAAGEHDFAAVAATLSARGVAAPVSGRTDWDIALLEAELAAANASFDAAYAERGYGA
ncbi:MAG: recombinase-like helix-turn-helix domain-containing protein [Pseudomonadota bacterium]